MAGCPAPWIERTLLLWRRRGFVRNEQGAVAIEFGLLAVPFFAILGAILETSLVFLSGQVLDSAVQDVSRLVRTGQAQQSAMTPERYRELVCDRLFGLFPDCDGLHVEMQVIGGFDEIDMSPPVKWVCDEPAAGQTQQQAAASCATWTRPELFLPGTGSDTVTVQVYYRWPLILPFAGLGLGNLPDGSRLMGAATVFRNEPFT